MKKIFISIILILLISVSAMAQECGPSCPVCSGVGNNSGALLAEKSIMFSAMSIPTADEETTVFNSRFGLLNWLDAGVGYAVETEKVLWSVRTQLLLEKENSWQPGLIIGTGSVQTGGSDQSIYTQLLKSFDLNQNTSLQFSVGTATLLPDMNEAFALAGVTSGFKDRYFAFVSYDGKSYHEGISWVASNRLTLSFLMVESELPAFSIILKR